MLSLIRPHLGRCAGPEQCQADSAILSADAVFAVVQQGKSTAAVTQSGIMMIPASPAPALPARLLPVVSSPPLRPLIRGACSLERFSALTHKNIELAPKLTVAFGANFEYNIVTAENECVRGQKSADWS